MFPEAGERQWFLVGAGKVQLRFLRSPAPPAIRRRLSRVRRSAASGRLRGIRFLRHRLASCVEGVLGDALILRPRWDSPQRASDVVRPVGVAWIIGARSVGRTSGVREVRGGASSRKRTWIRFEGVERSAATHEETIRGKDFDVDILYARTVYACDSVLSNFSAMASAGAGGCMPSTAVGGRTHGDRLARWKRRRAGTACCSSFASTTAAQTCATSWCHSLIPCSCA